MYTRKPCCDIETARCRCKIRYVSKFTAASCGSHFSLLPAIARLWFQIQRHTGLWYSVEYSSFSLGPEADKYRLSVSGFSGDDGDALTAPVLSYFIANGMRFSCLGEDNDNHPTALCMGGNSGWWFRFCTRSSINRDTNGLWNADTIHAIFNVVSSRMLVKLD